MLLVDDLLLAPFSSLLWIFKELHKAVQQEAAGEADAVTRALSELYMQLETGAITEEEFATEETRLLDRLEAIRHREEGDDEDTDDDSDEEGGEEGGDQEEQDGDAGARG